ncbi:receptor-like protein EIX2 [Vigna unguiculata]|uniref:receptor-like protein EIX2 n=1 Tax=Vigna unguiculata TaxID=3917 RepID=UPI001016EE49|nr:receptor-like protein EIX2 [Vigna unguiculata]
MQQLKILSLRVNHFFGSVPVQLCCLSQIQVLDLSRNNLSGEMPTCLRNFTTLMEKSAFVGEIVRRRKISIQRFFEYIYDSYLLLSWKGQDYEFWEPENLLKSIDLSSNRLTGEVPKEVGYLVGLVSLNLSRNNFHGEIPSEIGNLSLLEFLDLSRNNLSGSIPSTLSNIDSLGVLDLSNNNLSGRIPLGRHLQTFDASSFEGNIDLCGEQLNKSCPGDETVQETQQPAMDGEEDDSILYGGLYMSLGLGFFAGFWGLLGSMLLWQPWRIAYIRVLNRMIDYILVMAELNFAKCHRWLKG